MKKIIFLLMFTVFTCISNATSPVIADTNLAKHNVPVPPPPPADHYHAKVDIDDEVPNIAYVMPIAFFVFILVIIGFSQYYNYKRNKDRMALYLKYLEHGKEVPVNLLVQPRDVSSNLKRGVIFMAVGVGVMIFLFADAPNGTDWTLGVIPLLIGVGYLIVYKISPKTEAKTNEQGS